MTLLLVDDETDLHQMLGAGEIEVIERALHWRRVIADQINVILIVEELVQVQNNLLWIRSCLNI